MTSRSLDYYNVPLCLGDLVRVTEITTGVGFDAVVVAMYNNDIQIKPIGLTACPVWIARRRYDITVKREG